MAMGTRHKILILDDDPDWLALCRDQFVTLASHPDVITANNAKRWKPKKSGCSSPI